MDTSEAVKLLRSPGGVKRWNDLSFVERTTTSLASADFSGAKLRDVIFSGGVDGYFFALDAETGEELWHISLGALVQAAPITYAVDGQQYVTIAVGNVIYTFGLNE